ncbi:MAG TPA: ATP-binding protein [Pyrinomonadaceae bacterium]|nr:ATP-binding protein [Pyrinomonadaceae bacterium]
MGITIKNNVGLENRVLVFMPTGRDAALVCATLEQADVSAQACVDAPALEKEIAVGAGAVLLAEEGLQNGTLEHLIETFNRQPVWSDLPVVLFAGSANNSEKLLTTIGSRLNATIVERPIRVTMLISAVRGALRARQKQYQTRDLLNQLEESDHQKDLFLATLSHELRTPLNSILGWIQLLRGSSGAVDAEHGLEVIERNAKAQSEIISDILFVSRIITGKFTPNLQPIDLMPVIEEAVEVVLPSIESKHIDLKVCFDPQIKQIKGDHERLKQVFWNLLSNAVKFTPPTGTIEVCAEINGEYVEIEVRDSGMGIDPEFLPYIFERFSQADSSYTRKVGGLGLGLAIVRHLVEIHGGSVSVKSEGTNKGASFTIKLPVLAAPQTLSGANENPGKPDESTTTNKLPAGIKVLLVEDNDDSREMLAVLFAQADLDITAVASVAEALKAIEQVKPDILISDIGMPEEDGYDLIRKVRLLSPANGGRIPAIALTGYASLQDRDRALQAGYQEHLSKPVDIEELFELVKNILDRENHAAISG